jgi:hypothetical protein
MEVLTVSTVHDLIDGAAGTPGDGNSFGPVFPQLYGGAHDSNTRCLSTQPTTLALRRLWNYIKLSPAG